MVGIHRGIVDVRAVRERDAPPRHRALRIEARRLLERLRRLVVVEAVDEAQPLIEPVGDEDAPEPGCQEDQGVA